MKTILCLNFVLYFLLVQGIIRPKFLPHHEDLWRNHKKQYNLAFREDEDLERKGIFVDNLEKIISHNKKNLGFTLGMNQFGHWTHDEYLSFLSKSVRYENLGEHDTLREEYQNQNFTDIDWRTKNAVTPVQNQGRCGSCWAFSSTGALEGQYAINKGQLLKLSEQDLVDCTFKTYGNLGCNGGWMGNAFRYVKDRGINLASDYPYKASVETCKHNDTRSVLKVNQFFYIKRFNENDLCDKIQQVGPISLAIDASDYKFMFYKDGIFNSTNCNPSRVNHALLAVGLGSTPEKHYIIKNTWGTSWGNRGYIKFAAFHNNLCGVASWAIYPTIN